MKNDKGITLTSLVITIIVMLIIATITVNYGKESIKKAELENLKTNMLLIEAKAKEYVEQANFKVGNSNQYSNGEDELKGVKLVGNGGYEYIEIADGTYEFLYDVTEQLNDMGLKNVELKSNEKYLVKYNVKDANVEIYNTIGHKFEENGVTQYIHDLTSIKNIK